jgi:glucans biosynthesis protein
MLMLEAKLLSVMLRLRIKPKGEGGMIRGDNRKVMNDPMKESYSPLCLALTRKKTLCRKTPARGKKRCRMHGGAEGSGAKLGNRNAFKHGRYSREYIENKRNVIAFFKQCRASMKEMNV